MKVALGLLLVVGLGLFLAFQFGGIGGFDPAEQAAKLKTDVKPGMPWNAVADKFPPKKFSAVVILDRGLPGETQPLKFDRAEFDKNMKAGEFKLGFKFYYLYGAEHQYSVNFDLQGNAKDVEKLLTMGDLLEPR